MQRHLTHLAKKIMLRNLKYPKASIVSITAKIQDSQVMFDKLQELARGNKT